MTTTDMPMGMEERAEPSHSRRESLRAEVRDHYAAAARAVSEHVDAGCCGPIRSDFETSGYDETARAVLPAGAVAGSLGCGNPTLIADLRPGETVLDLGCGGGIDALLAAREVGPAGKAIGVDMTDEMLALARRNAADAAVDNVEFVKGDIETLPLPDSSVDVVISNCVINLAVDKPAVFTEMARVLRAGGRVGVADIVAEDRLSPDERAERGDYAGCIAGALSVSEFDRGLTGAGFVDVSVTLTGELADGIHSAIVRAVKR
jgi:arsenite methyltransferase